MVYLKHGGTETIPPAHKYGRILKNQQYISLLEQLTVLESGRIFCRHDLQHFLDVARLMYIIALEKHLSLSKELIYAAALLHDIGRVKQYTQQIPHNIASAEIARSILNDCGFLPEECSCICHAILDHRHAPANSQTHYTLAAPHSQRPAYHLYAPLPIQRSGCIRTLTLSTLLYRADKLSRNCFCCHAKEDCYWEDSKMNQSIIY